MIGLVVGDRGGCVRQPDFIKAITAGFAWPGTSCGQGDRASCSTRAAEVAG